MLSEQHKDGGSYSSIKHSTLPRQSDKHFVVSVRSLSPVEDLSESSRLKLQMEH